MKSRPYLGALTALLFGLAAISVIFAIAYVQQVQRSARQLDIQFSNLQPDIAKAIADKDWILLSKIGPEISAHGYFAYGVVTDGRAVYSYPSEDSLASCKADFVKEIELYGIKLGQFFACSSRAEHASEVLKSPSFALICLFVLILVGLATVLPLLKYRRSLNHLMTMMENHLNAGDRSPIALSGDAIADRIMAMFNALAARQISLQREVINLEKDREVARLATQTAHDIRSPLSVLNSMAHALKVHDDQNSDLINQVVLRINLIAEQLLTRAKFQGRMASAPETIVAIFNEKKVEFQSYTNINFALQIDLDKSKQLMVRESDLQRAVSNLINNSVEALPNKSGSIDLIVTANGEWVNIQIADSGKGISEEILGRVGQHGFSHGKSGGNGLGVYAAKSLIEAVGGQFNIISSLGSGTKIELKFPLASENSI